MNSYFQVPKALNEPVLAYQPDSPELKRLLSCYRYYFSHETAVPQYIEGKEIFSGQKHPISPPHDHQHVIGHYHKGDEADVKKAITSALAAKKAWEATSPEERASVFLKAAALAAGPYRDKLNAATMLGQSKNVHQAEIDSACELIDFLRFNVEYMTRIYAEQPNSSSTDWNKVDYRPLEGFVLAITPFNFTAIAGNLPASPAMMGNTVVWKPSLSQLFSAKVIMELFQEAGLPDGVINMIITDPQKTVDIACAHPEFAGLHFTGSTEVFKNLWKTIGDNMNTYRSYPRIVGETGGKNFIWVHPSAQAESVVANIVRGAFEFQGQKCSAASRVYIPASLWEKIETPLKAEVESIKMGSPEDPSNFVTAVIHKTAFDRIVGYIEHAKKDGLEIIAGGTYDDSKGYFIRPTVFKTTDPSHKIMQEEIFGPVVTIYVYEDAQWENALELVNKTSSYGLTGAIFARDKEVVRIALQKLRHAAGNTYINDKPTGAVVGHQPFGGGRTSGTNDKAGAILNLFRWVSPRLIKEALLPVTNYRYPYLGE